MISNIAEYLRELAPKCTRLARRCPHLATSHELGALSVDLMLKAKQLEELEPWRAIANTKGL
jgi:hypothetical protein